VSLLHIFRKLNKMSPQEITFRCRGLVYEQLERLKHSGPLSDGAFFRALNVKDTSSQALWNYIRKRENVVFFIDEHNKQATIETINKQYPQLIQQAREQANKICRHEFSFLGIQVNYEDKIPWTSDPVSTKKWLQKFYADVNIFDREIGDVKYVWELNRHQFFVDLGKAYWLSGDERYAQEFFGLINSWIDDNPYKMGVNWTSALEVAVRSISWIWAYHFCLFSSSLTQETNLKILKSIYQHAEYLENHLSFYSSPYNHLIGELSALFIIATVFPEFKRASLWREKSWKILKNEAGKQFYQDGIIVEQATFYQHFTLGFYLMVALLREMNEQQGSGVKGQGSDKVWHIIEKAMESSMYLTRPDGLLPMIGDIDNARSIYIENPPMWDFRAFLSTGTVLFNRGDMKKVAEELSSGKGFDEDSLWLLGIDGMKKYQEIDSVYPEVTSKALDESGYYIMRNNWMRDSNYLCFDCGEIAVGLFQDSTPSAAHGHADILSFELSAFGRPMIIDPGFYTYHGDERLHYYFRQTKAHNTITIDGQSQAQEAGKLSWSHAPDHYPKKWISNKDFDFVEGSHDGYKRLADPVIHRRAILFKKEGATLSPEYWIIRDYLDGNREHLVESFFHFAHGIALNIQGRDIVAQSSAEAGILIQTIVPHQAMMVDIIDTGNIPDGGWIAPGYGFLIRAPILRYQARVKLPFEMTTIIYPFKGNIPPSISPELIQEGLRLMAENEKV